MLAKAPNQKLILRFDFLVSCYEVCEYLLYTTRTHILSRDGHSHNRNIEIEQRF